MSISVKEYVDAFISNINNEIHWNYLKSGRKLKKQISDIIFEISFYSSKYNDIDSHIEIRSECRVWCRKYDKSHTVKSAIANIPFLEKKEYWWDITGEGDRTTVFQALIQEINTKVIYLTSEMETDFISGLLHLIYRHGFSIYSNSIQLVDELFGREEALKAAGEYSEAFTVQEQNMLKRYLAGEISLVNERNLRYMIDNHLADSVL